MFFKNTKNEEKLFLKVIKIYCKMRPLSAMLVEKACTIWERVNETLH